MEPTQIDRRAVVFGALAGAVVVAGPLFFARARLSSLSTIAVAVIGVGLVNGVVSGVVAGYTSRIELKPMEEGAIAATLGLTLGVVLWAGGQMLISPLHPADTALVLLFAIATPLLGVYPFAILLGALFGERVLFATSAG